MAAPSARQCELPIESGLWGVAFDRRFLRAISPVCLAGCGCHNGGSIVDVVSDTSQIIQSEVADPILDEDDHERFSHIVLEGYTPTRGLRKKFVPVGNSVVEGMINGTPVEALCGKRWVPGKDPKKYPLCPTCKEIAVSRGWTVPGS